MRTAVRLSSQQPSSMLTFPSSFSVLPALSLHDGILHCDIVEGSFCTETFLKFVDGLLDYMQPYPAPNSVIVMDNCQIHKHPEIQQRILERWCTKQNSLWIFFSQGALGECMSNFCLHIHLATIQSNLLSLPWSSISKEMVHTHDWQWRRWVIMRSISPSLKPYIPLHLLICLDGTCIVAMCSVYVTTVKW